MRKFLFMAAFALGAMTVNAQELMYSGSHEGYRAVQKGRLHGLIHDTDDDRIIWKIPLKYQDMGNVQNGMVAAKLGGKWGLITLDETEVIPFEYDGIGWAQDGSNHYGYKTAEGLTLYAVRIGDKKGFIIPPTEVVIPIEYASFEIDDNGLAIARISTGLGNYWYSRIDLEAELEFHSYGEEPVKPEYFSNINFVNKEKAPGLLLLKNDLNRYFLAEGYGDVHNKDMELMGYKGLYYPYFVFNELSRETFTSKWGIYQHDPVGKKLKRLDILPDSCKPESINEMCDGIRITVSNQEGKQGIMDMHGNIIIPIVWDAVHFGVYCPLYHDEVNIRLNPKQELYRVCRNGKWGFVNTKNEVIIPLKFDNVGWFQRGAAYVDDAKKGYYIDIRGKKTESRW